MIWLLLEKYIFSKTKPICPLPVSIYTTDYFHHYFKTDPYISGYVRFFKKNYLFIHCFGYIVQLMGS